MSPVGLRVTCLVSGSSQAPPKIPRILTEGEIRTKISDLQARGRKDQETCLRRLMGLGITADLKSRLLLEPCLKLRFRNWQGFI